MVAWAGIIGAVLFGRAAAQVGSWQTLAGYQTASDVGPHSMIDLDMAEIETAVGTYATNANWLTEALMIYTNGGNGGNGNSIKGSGAIRHIKGFATSGEAKMTRWTTYPVYKAYYNDFNYADTFITNAATHTNANGDDDQFRQQMIKKGAAYMAVWMYVLHEFEDAIKDCTTGDITANDDSVHAWDEGWAFYAGSAVGTDGADSGDLLYGLANSRCKNFGTCASGATGLANANSKALAAAIAGRDDITTAKCTGGVAQLKILTEQMTIPLVQGTLKYAWEADPAMTGSACAGQVAPFDASCSKAWAKGWTFASAVLPQISACSWAHAKTVKDNLDASLAAPMTGGLAALKAAVEACYPSMGITCDEVGEYQWSGVVFSRMAKCSDPGASCDVCREKLFEGHCRAFSQEAKGKWDDWTYFSLGEPDCISDVCCASNEEDCCELNVGVVVGTAIGVLVFLVGSILVCCKFCPGCPMNKDGGKPAKRSPAPPVHEPTALAPIKAETHEMMEAPPPLAPIPKEPEVPYGYEGAGAFAAEEEEVAPAEAVLAAEPSPPAHSWAPELEQELEPEC